MEIKILQVFLGADGLPYKDQERTVHFPIVGSGFQGASNTTKIRFYYDELVEQDDTETAWVACAKLPNGKIGSKVLETDYDSTLGEHYALLELDSFYFQYKGDVYISLQGYQGGVQVDYDEETELYTIYGTPTIAATGSIKLSVNYATQFVGSGETSNVNFQRILADLGTKLGIRSTSVYVEELPTVGNPDTFYVIHNDLSDPNKANIYIWNTISQNYVWVGDNTLDLGNYYTKEQGEQFEEEIDNRVTSVENELSSVASGSPKGVYATLADLQTAYPTGTEGVYLVSADGHWYYWNGVAWTDGGAYLSSLPDNALSTSSTNSVQNKIVTKAINNIHDIISSYGNLVFSILVGFIRSNNNGVVSSPWSNASYVCAEANVKAGTYIAVNYNWLDNSFGMFADDQGNVIGRADTYKDTSKGDYIYLVPTGATKLYFSSNVSTGDAATIYQNYGYVVLEREKEITQPTRFGITEYPYGEKVKYKTDNLYVGIEKFSDYISKYISSSYMVYSKTNLANLNDAPTNSIGCFLIPASTLPENLPTNYPSPTIIKGTGLLITILSSNSGLKTQTYLSIVSGLSWNRVWTSGNGWSSWNKINLKNTYTCKKSGGDFDNLVTAINTVCQEMDATLYVGEGEWDLIDELGSAYVESVDNHQMGLVLKNRVHIICSSRAKIVCKYTGNNASTREWLSAFNSGEYGFTLENAYIETDNIRYTVHDDRGENTDNYENKYINCIMKHTNGFYEQCIGGGFGINGYIIVKGCKFVTDKTANSFLVSWHNSADGAWNDSASQGAKSFLEIKDCYFTEKGSIHLINFGKSPISSQVLISNNSLGSDISKTNGSRYYYDNIEITSWNNEIRGS